MHTIQEQISALKLKSILYNNSLRLVRRDLDQLEEEGHLMIAKGNLFRQGKFERCFLPEKRTVGTDQIEEQRREGSFFFNNIY